MRLLRHLVVVGALLANLTGIASAAAAGTPAGSAPSTAPAAPGAVPATAPASSAADAGSESSATLDAARGKVAAGDTKGAIAQLAPYVVAHPADAAAGRLLGDIYFRIPDYPRAEHAWRAVLAQVPGDAETHSRLGSLYSVEDRIDAAIAEFQKSLPTRAGYEGLTQAHRRAGDLDKYFHDLEFATTKFPFDAEAWMNLGRARHETRQNDLALEALTHAVGLRPAECDPRIEIANVLVDMHRIEPAIAALKTCLGNDPRSYAANVNLGEAYLEEHQIAAARPYLDRALALRPQGTEALVDVGYIADMSGDWKTATTYYNRAIRADPMRPEAYIDLGYDYNEHRIFTLAEAAFLKGISVASDDGRLHYLLAVTYNLQGKIALAREEYRQALNSGEPDVVVAANADLKLLPPA